MTQVQYIRYLYKEEKLSLREISRKTGHSFKTVQKYVYMEDFNKPDVTKTRPQRFPVLEGFISIIDKWIEDDLKAPNKQRHTASRMFNRLKKEYGFKGSYSSVRRYVQKKKRLSKQTKTGYLPLEQRQAEAQADFGVFKYFDGNGIEQTGYALTITFPYSNKGYTQAFPSQNKECLLTGMKRIFEYIGGVPKNIKFDNMSTAVSRIKTGTERDLTDEFLRFMLHYGFKAQFCNPACGNEKGNVENKVGYSRRNALVPMPKITSFDEFNEWLFAWCEEDATREHYKHKVTIQSLWEEERSELLSLPVHEYQVYRYETVTINKYGFATIDTNKYGLSPSLAGELVQAKIYFDSIEFFYEGQNVGVFKRCYEENQEICDWKQYLPILIRKPGATEHTRFFNKMPKEWQSLLKECPSSQKKSALKLLLEIVEDGNQNLCDEVALMAFENGRTDPDSVRQCYYFMTKREYHPQPIDTVPAVLGMPSSPNLSIYDGLTGGVYE